MPEGRILASITEAGRGRWDALFPGEPEGYDYLLAVEKAGFPGFQWRYLVVEQGDRLLAAAPMFICDYPLETTLTPFGQRLVAGVRSVAPRALILRMACLGSPCTETMTVGFADDLAKGEKPALLSALLGVFEAAAEAARCGLIAIKDVPEPLWSLFDRVAEAGRYLPIPGLAVAHLDIDFASVETYLSRLSPGTRKDMRRKLRSQLEVRVEIRTDLDGVLDRVVALYGETLARAEMRLEELTDQFFSGVAKAMPGRAFYVLYYVGDTLLAANLLIQDGDTLLDKFFCMTAHGRDYNLYFLSWFNNVQLCLDRGLSRYQSGQASYADKLRLGSRLTNTAMYFRHRNRVINVALQLAAPFLSSDPSGASQAARERAA